MRHTSDGMGIDHLAIAILRRAESVVLVQQQGPDDPYPYWVLPGGLVEAGELITDALIREVWEEAGVQVTALIKHLQRDGRGRERKRDADDEGRGSSKPHREGDTRDYGGEFSF